MPGMTPAIDDAYAAPGFPGWLFLPVERRIGRLAMARLYSVADQGLSGLANIAALLVLGRVLPVAAFAALGMMIGLHYFVAGFHRSAVVLGFLTIHRERPDSAEAQAEASSWWWLSVIASLVLATLLAFVAVLLAMARGALPFAAWLAEPFAMAALVTPPMLAAEFTRRWLFRIGRPDLVALIALVYFATLAGASLLLATGTASAMGASFAWGGASLVACLIALPVLRPRRPDAAGLKGIVAVRWREAGWLAGAHLPYAVYSSATIVVLIGAIVGPLAAAVFTAARTLANPAMSIVSAIDSTDKPRAAQALATGGSEGLRDAVARTRRLIAIVTGAYLLPVAIWAGPITALAYHGQYPDLTIEVRLLALAFFLAGLNQPSETLLISLRGGATMLRLRAATALVALTALFVSARWGVTAMAAAVAATHALNLAMLLGAERRAVRLKGE